jgi:serine/threonine protein kinase
MSFEPGTRAGLYEIVGPLGAGGMGEVYRARDTRLGREARQIAGALKAAHAQAIVRRDPKPGNVKITPDGRVKVLDFGLAKALEPDGAEAALSDSPTLTRAGDVLGTAAYMSPEQARGLEVDRSASGKPLGRLQQLTKGAGQDVEVALSPDGGRLAFATLRQNADIWRLSVSPETGSPVGPPEELVATTRQDSRGAWSPDGRAIAFNSDRTGDMNIWLHSLEDGFTRPLTRGPGGDFQPSWSPNGKSLAFFSSRSGSVDIWKVDLASLGLTQLTKGGSIHGKPFFSPDGAWIAYHGDEGGRLEVWVMRSDGSEARPLTRVRAAAARAR